MCSRVRERFLRHDSISSSNAYHHLISSTFKNDKFGISRQTKAKQILSCKSGSKFYHTHRDTHTHLRHLTEKCARVENKDIQHY